MTTMDGAMLAATGEVLKGSYDYQLVALSVVIAVLASYAALDLAGRVRYSRGAARRLWLGGGATAMGIGIWSMHYSECWRLACRYRFCTTGRRGVRPCWRRFWRR
jgi:Bacterial signalling protein N terminal repeat